MKSINSLFLLHSYYKVIFRHIQLKFVHLMKGNLIFYQNW